VKKKDYQWFISISNWSFQSSFVKYNWAAGTIIVIILSLKTYFYPSPYDTLDDVGILGLMSFTAIWIVMFFVIVSIGWHLVCMIRAIRRFYMMPLEIRPLDPDKAGGLKPLANLTFQIAMFPLIGIVGLMYSIFIVGHSIFKPSQYLMLITLITAMFGLFLYPLAQAHSKMDEKKREILRELADEHDRVFNLIKEELPKEKPVITEKWFAELDGLAKLYDRADRMPVWPFDIKIIGQFGISVLVPVILVLIQIYLSFV
jgi:hypothetical protein